MNENEYVKNTLNSISTLDDLLLTAKALEEKMRDTLHESTWVVEKLKNHRAELYKTIGGKNECNKKRDD